MTDETARKAGFADKIGAVVAAAFVLALVDLAWMTNDVFSVSGYAVTAVLEVFAGVTLGLLCFATAIVIARSREQRLVIKLERPVAFAALALFPIAVIGLAPGIGLISGALLALVILVNVGVGHVVLKRGWIPALHVAVGSVVGAMLAVGVSRELRLIERIGADASIWVLLSAGAGVAALVVGLMIGALLQPTRRTPTWFSLLCLTLGCLAPMLPAMMSAGRYPEVQAAIDLGSVVILSLGLVDRVQLPPRVLGAVAVISALAVSVLVVAPEAHESDLQYAAQRSMFGDPIFRLSGILHRASERRVAQLVAQDIDCAEWLQQEPVAPADVRASSVILVTVDSLRYDYVGYSGGFEDSLTPSLDRLSARGRRFHRAYTQGGYTSLAMPSLLWSLHPKDIEFTPLVEDFEFHLHLPEDLSSARVALRQRYQSPLREPTRNIAEVLAGTGVHTVSVPNDGHTSYFDPRLGFSRGFDEVRYPKAGLDGEGPFVTDDEAATDLAIAALEQVHEQPFMLWLHLFEPHAPDRVPSGDSPEGYKGDVRFADRQIGRLFDAVERLGLTDKTAIIVTSDHGEDLTRYQGFLVGHGLHQFEEAIKVPLIIAAPGLAPGDEQSEVGIIDLAPTMLTMLGVDSPETFVGRNLFDGKPLDGPVFSETWRYRGNSGVRSLHMFSAVWRQKKVIYDATTSALSFYDLAADPQEDRPATGGEVMGETWAMCLTKRLATWHSDIWPQATQRAQTSE